MPSSLPIFLQEHTPLAGSSAGSIICAAVACGVDIRVALDVTKGLCADCRENGTVFRLGVSQELPVCSDKGYPNRPNI